MSNTPTKEILTKQILLIEDEPMLSEVIAVCLESFKGWSVKVCNSGREGLHILKTVNPDAILLDVMMPEMDGITVYKHLQKDLTTQNIPVIFLTAKYQPRDRKLFKELGAAGAIAKPFDPLRLAEEVAQILGW
jgi:CheY-like chemotaxis protein